MSLIEDGCIDAGMVDVIFADVAQPDQARIVSINAQHFLKNQGHFVISIKVGEEIKIQRTGVSTEYIAVTCFAGTCNLLDALRKIKKRTMISPS